MRRHIFRCVRSRSPKKCPPYCDERRDGLTSAPASPVLRMLNSQDLLANTVADYIKNNFRDKKVGLWLPAGGTFATKVEQSIESRNVRPFAVETSSGAAQPSWLGAAEVVVTSQGSASSLVGPPANSKLNIVIPAAVLNGQLMQVVRRGTGVVALTDPPAEYFPDAAQVLAKAKDARADTGGYFIYAYASVQVFAEAARRAAISGR